jgi:hypothetical protein
MDELEKFVDEAGKLLETIEQKEARAKSFIEPLVEELLTIAIRHFAEIETIDVEKKNKIAYGAFYRAEQLKRFMFKRIYEGVDDMEEDTAQFYVPPRNDEEGNRRKLEKQLKTIPPEYHESYTEVFYEGIEVDKPYNEFLYDCFDRAKLSLWVAFPEISELTGNSILHMNWQAYDCMRSFGYDLYEIIER